MKPFVRVLLYIVVIAAVVALGIYITSLIAGFSSVWEMFDFVKGQLA